MFTLPTTLTVTDLRRRSAQILQDLPKEKIYLLIQNSKAKGAVVDLEYLKTLQKTYEDYLDIQTFDQTINGPDTPWKEYKKKSAKTKKMLIVKK